MAERDAREGEVQGLPRLPPGRHGLDREFVVKNQRDRLTAGIIAVVADQGYHDASVTQICAAAGVSRRTFYSYFPSKEKCYLEAFDLVNDHLVQVIGEAGAEGDEWPVLARKRIVAMLETYAANPDLVRFTLIAPLRAGAEIAMQYRQALNRLFQSLVEGRPKGDGVRRAAPAIEQSVAGGMMALIARRVEEGAGENLPLLAPDLVELFLSPYLGHAAAARAAHPPE